MCPKCRRLRPLTAGYQIDTSVFMWAQDGAAMAKLRSIGPINKAAQSISDTVGRRWVETTFNAVRLGENQLPAVYGQAVLAARVLGMTHMPDVYVAGDRMWDALTYGSDRSAFIIIGTALLTNFKDDDLLFVLAREMGHVRAGHALWKTVIRFLLGDTGPRKGFMQSGVLACLDPAHLVEGALEMPLLAWARQAEITADRAGMLALGDEDVARRVLLSWSLKSAALFRQINVGAWLEQQEEADDQMVKLSEIASSSTPYLSRRLKQLSEYVRGPEMGYYFPLIRPLIVAQKPAPTAASAPAAPPRPPAPRPVAPAAPRPADPPRAAVPPGPADPVPGAPARAASAPVAPPRSQGPTASAQGASDDIRLACPHCKTPMRIPRAKLEGHAEASIRCPDSSCARIVSLKKKPRPQPAPPAPPAHPAADDGSMAD